MVFDRFTDTNCYMMTADADEGGDERVIGASDSARNFLNPQWSPDGTKILFFDIEERADGLYWSLAEVPAEGGASRTVLAPRRQKIWFMAWADGGRGVVINATDPATKLPQLYYVSYPDGETRRVTNDLLYYNGVSVSGDRVVTSLKERPTKVWVTPWPDPQPARQLAGDGDLCDALSWTPDGRIVYDTSDDGRYHIWIMDGDGRRRQQLSPDRVEDRLPDISPDGSHIAFLSNRSGAWALWLMDADGSGARQLTPGGGIWSPRFAPDGQSVYFEMEQGTQNYIARIPIKGGNPEVLVGGLSSYTLYDVSPDGRQLAYSFPDKELQRMRVAVRPVGGGAPEAYFDIDPGYFLRWTPDGKGLAYAQERDDHKAGSAIWVQPLAGGPPQQLIGFEQDLVIYAAWSRDARQLAFGRGRLLSDIVLLSRAKAQP
jgi:Tol biopolymer transport system component